MILVREEVEHETLLLLKIGTTSFGLTIGLSKVHYNTLKKMSWKKSFKLSISYQKEGGISKNYCEGF